MPKILAVSSCVFPITRRLIADCWVTVNGRLLLLMPFTDALI
jgi:hypothetical protein